MAKRTSIDFSKHQLIIDHSDNAKIYILQLSPNKSTTKVIFINSNGVMAVTGDFGNWIFCREFLPSKTEGVSDGYWLEKLHIHSKQVYENFDSEKTYNILTETLKQLEEDPEEYSEDNFENYKEYLEGCLFRTDDESSYTVYARDELPSFLDYQCIVFEKSIDRYLLAIFDAFEEICSRL